MSTHPQHRFPGGALAAFVLLQGGWFGCVLGPLYGHHWLPIAIAISAIAATWAHAPARSHRLGVVFAFASVGCVSDLLQAQWGVLSFPQVDFGLPGWMVSLWVLFAATYPHCFGWMRGRPKTAFALGFIAAPPCYLAGDSFGALQITANTSSAYLALGLAWALLLAGVVLASTGSSRARVETAKRGPETESEA